MPQLDKVLTEEDLRGSRAAGGALDLAPYTDIIDNIREQGGVGGALSLSQDENQRAEKRRLSVAAKQRGFTLVWRKAPERQLRFVLAEEGKPAPGSRRRQAGARTETVAARLSDEPVEGAADREQTRGSRSRGAGGGRSRAGRKVNPVQVQKFLGGVDYPARRDDLVRAAEQHGADENVRTLLQQLPDEAYETPAEVSQAMGAQR